MNEQEDEQRAAFLLAPSLFWPPTALLIAVIPFRLSDEPGSGRQNYDLAIETGIGDTIAVYNGYRDHIRAQPSPKERMGASNTKNKGSSNSSLIF